MKEYTVEVRGEVREVYVVDAESEADALARWHEGDIVLSEAYGCGPISAQVDE